jgi:hypothetical protein
VTAYKFLRAGAVGPFTGYRWPTPTGDAPARWVGAEGALGLCENGIHACRLEDLPYWIDEELWALEVDEAAPAGHQILSPRARLIRRIDAWTQAVATEYGLGCMRRARDLGAADLAAAGLETEAAGLAGASLPDEVREAGHSGSAAAREAGAARAARVSYAAGTAGWHMAVPVSTPRYFAYPAFAAYSAAVAADTVAGAAGYEAERQRQAGWLADRLGLADG